MDPVENNISSPNKFSDNLHSSSPVQNDPSPLPINPSAIINSLQNSNITINSAMHIDSVDLIELECNLNCDEIVIESNVSMKSLDYVVEFCELVSDITGSYEQKRDLIDQISWSHQEVCRILMRALKDSTVGLEELDPFIKCVSSKSGQMYFYAHLAKTLHLLGRAAESKEICSKFVEKASLYKRCFFEYPPRLSMSVKIDADDASSVGARIAPEMNLPSFIDIIYGILIIPELTTAQVNELVALAGDALLEHEYLRKTQSIADDLFPEESLIPLVLSYRGYEIVEEALKGQLTYLETRNFGSLFFSLLEKHPDTEIAVAVLHFIHLAWNPLCTLKDFVKLRWSHLYEPSIRYKFIEQAKRYNLLNGEPNDIRKGSEIISSDDGLILKSDFGELNLSNIRYMDGEYDDDEEGRDEQLMTFRTVYQFLALLDKPDDSSLLQAVQTIREEIETDDIDQIIYSVFSCDVPINWTDYLYRLIEQKLTNFNYPRIPVLVTKEVLADYLQRIPNSLRSLLSQHFPCDDLVQRHQQARIIGWIEANKALQDPSKAIKQLKAKNVDLAESRGPEDEIRFHNDILTILTSYHKKRKPDGQLTPAVSKQHLYGPIYDR